MNDNNIAFLDQTEQSLFGQDVIHGLSQRAKTLPCKWFYDVAGSELFEQITKTPEYYLTRVETRLLLDLAPELAGHIPDLSLIIETRKPESIVMKSVESGNPGEFYRSDIEERERYAYPPFSTFVGLRAIGSRQTVEKNRLRMAEEFKDDDLVGPLPAVFEGRNEWGARAVIRVKRGAWPDEALSARLRHLPPDIEVAIDPDEIV